MSVPAGSIIISKGNGKVTTLQPNEDNMVLVIDNTNNKKVKFEKIERLLKNQTFKSMNLTQKSYNSSNFEKVGSVILPGSNTTIIKKIVVLCYMNSSGQSYDIRFYDPINNKIIAFKNFTNTSSNINDMGTLSNLPMTDTVVELQAKFNGNGSNKYIYIDEVVFNFDSI